MTAHTRRVDANINHFKEATGTHLHSVRSFAAKHPGVTEGGVRWFIFNARENGLADSGALVRMGRKVLLDEVQFLEWLRGGNAKQAV